ncbi:Abi-like protein [Pseudidiomarina indica]|uniref:Abi-like protein n=1 Tax=Pseudidiomarina indica TaxID=1159017 RepID=A0A1G6DZL8_9GAMM|nr:Abi family protein [Pseudidiomarina indica]SDB50215.1 Abi-like protein [Pseudidiomarina indica]
MRPTNLQETFSALSTPRINAYKVFFGSTLCDDQIFGCYQWNEALSHSMFKLISLIEIIMRNRMHSALSVRYFNQQKKVVENFKDRQWTKSASATIGHQSSCNWYNSEINNSFILNKKGLNNIHSVTHHGRNGRPLAGSRSPSADDVVSSLTFGFWSSLVEKCPDIDWPNTLSQIYPNHRVSKSNQWNSNIEQTKLSYRLELIRNFRNRVAHHEPIWKLGNLLSEQPPMSNGQLNTHGSRTILDSSPSTPKQSIRRLRSIYSRHTELLRWMSQEIYDDYNNSSLHKQILWLCSEDGLEAHLNRATEDFPSLKTAKFKRELSSIIKTKKSAYLFKNGRNLLAVHHIA